MTYFLHLFHLFFHILRDSPLYFSAIAVLQLTTLLKGQFSVAPPYMAAIFPVTAGSLNAGILICSRLYGEYKTVTISPLPDWSASKKDNGQSAGTSGHMSKQINITYRQTTANGVLHINTHLGHGYLSFKVKKNVITLASDWLKKNCRDILTFSPYYAN